MIVVLGVIYVVLLITLGLTAWTAKGRPHSEFLECLHWECLECLGGSVGKALG